MSTPHAKDTKPSTLARLLAWLGFTTLSTQPGRFQAATLDRPATVPESAAAPSEAPAAPVAAPPSDVSELPKRTSPLADDDHGSELRREITAYEAQLRTELTHAQWRLVERLTDAQGALDNAEHTDELDRHAEALARHFGCLAPLIRALHWHLVEETAGREVDECGLFPDCGPTRPTEAPVRTSASG